jgi:hypothetical protein
MKRTLPFFTLAALALAQQVQAQTTATASANASATILSTPITLSKTADLAFGSMLRPTTGSYTVQVDPADGQRSIITGTGTLSGSGESRAQFSVGGDGGQFFTITLPASAVTITHVGTADTIPVTLAYSVVGSTQLSGTSGSSGSKTFFVGGTMPVSSTLPIGGYTGSFDVTVGYN